VRRPNIRWREAISTSRESFKPLHIGEYWQKKQCENRRHQMAANVEAARRIAKKFHQVHQNFTFHASPEIAIR
jgi:hypothetical protein